jgi:hypothetical protein
MHVEKTLHLFVYSRPFETSMRGPLRHLWVAGGPQRQLLETIDVAATGFVLPIRSGRTMRSVVFWKRQTAVR